MQFRLLIDVEVFDFLQSLSVPRRRRVLAQIRRLRDSRSIFPTPSVPTPMAGALTSLFFEGLAIYCWIDGADRHVKVLKITIED